MIATISTVATSKYSRSPKQERSRVSFDRVLDTATRLLAKEGYEGFNITEVSRLSKVSIGSIYGRVDSKDDLLRSVQDRFLKEVDAEHLVWTDPALWKGQTLASMLPRLVDHFAQSMTQHAPLFRAFISRSLADPVLRSRGTRTYSLLLRRFSELLLQRRDEIHHSQPEHAVDVCGRLVWVSFASFLGIENAVTAHGGEIKELVGDLSQMCLLFLTRSVNGSGAKRRRSV